MNRRDLLSTLAFAPTLGAAEVIVPETRSAGSDWRAIVAERLPLYGHRNWIVIADSAYPEQSQPGIETIISGADHLRVLRETLHLISLTRHVRPLVHQDAELKYVAEQDAPGVEFYRSQAELALQGLPVHSAPHLEIIRKLAETATAFNVLIVKTTQTIPYSSIFLELACAYWPDEAEQRLRKAMRQSTGR